MRHYPEHHPELPSEKGENLDPKSKLLMNTVREVVLGILRGEPGVMLKKYKKVDWKHPPKYLGRVKKITFPIPHDTIPVASPKRKDSIKDIIHDALEEVGIHHGNTEDKITKALDALGGQYKRMSSERFKHRLRIKKKKVDRDTEFLIGMVRFMSQQGDVSLPIIIDMLLEEKGNYMSLIHKSPSMRALYHLLQKAQKSFGKGEKGREEFAQFLKMLEEKMDAKE